MRELREIREIKDLGKFELPDPSQKDGVKKIGWETGGGSKIVHVKRGKRCRQL
jgi:hypothetical protein